MTKLDITYEELQDTIKAVQAVTKDKKTIIEMYDSDAGKWGLVLGNPQFRSDEGKYRLKPKEPKPKYRPFTHEELVSHFAEGTLVSREGEGCMVVSISAVHQTSVTLGPYMTWRTTENLLNEYQFHCNGRPFGKEIE